MLILLAATGLYLQSVFDDLMAIVKSSCMNTGALNNAYRRIVDVLQFSSDLTVPSRPKNFLNSGGIKA